MSSFNRVILMGNLTRDPELRSTPGGTQLTDITLAVNEHYTDAGGTKQERVHFVDITFWGKGAESLCRWKKKGDPLLIEGRLNQDKWKDKETGKDRSKLKVVGSGFTFLGRAGGGGGENKPAGKSAREQFEEPSGYSSGGEEPPF